MIIDILNNKIQDYNPENSIDQENVLQELMQHFVQDKSTAASAVKKAFLRTDSIGQILTLNLPFPRQQTKKIRIKLEVDTHPPEGSIFETHFITFPMTAAITAQTLESGFATKSHALLCREYVKGRDWYDFLWYISKHVVPDLALLEKAVTQQGPWAGRKVRVTAKWYIDTLRDRIHAVDWETARQDVARFIPSKEQENLNLWKTDLFLYHLDRLSKELV